MKTYVRAVVRDRRGRVINDTGWKETNTLTKNFYAFLRCAMQSYNTLCVRTDGSAGTIEHPALGDDYFMRLRALAGADDIGIVVGSGTTEPTRNDYNLESQIPHGTGTGQLYYYECNVDFGDDYVQACRTFENQSGADITINEVGLIAQYYDYDLTASAYALIARSLFTLTIPAGGSATIYYKISG